MKKAIELTEQTGTKGIQVQIAGRIDRNSNGSEKAGFPYKQFALKLITVPIQLELSMES
ncbi:30S ribosomal protein S3, chloroplastic [Dendrobium catenatum]|uniref:30S ribosomal protein S3, chloroplastic n=1 Tax=Dendrobium catenatum TaxID=906689 RepID=A0A2I0X555_9ASPA|nr:30S ribosomal protein S3, chloroplastic [Dendrobium catenatum]